MKGMVLTMKIFAIDLFRYNEKIESIVYACAAYDEVISVPEESGAVSVDMNTLSLHTVLNLVQIVGEQ